MTSTVLATLTGNYSDTSKVVGQTLAAGTYVGGNYSAVSVTSGVIQVHNR